MVFTGWVVGAVGTERAEARGAVPGTVPTGRNAWPDASSAGAEQPCARRRQASGDADFWQEHEP